MKKRILFLSVAILCSIILSISAHAGKIVLSNDEWTLSNTGFFAPNDPAIFAGNVASWFNNGIPGSYLAYSSNFGLNESALAAAITSAGHTWNVSMALPFNLATLSNYDGVFLAGNAVDNNVLINYVNNGGNVYLAGGTGFGGAANEAAQWNAFLNYFGLGFGTSYNGVQGSIEINSIHPMFQGVDHLYQNNGNDALDILVSDPRGQVILSANGHGLYAAFDSGSSPGPEPTTMLLLGLGLVGIAGVRKKFKKQ